MDYYALPIADLIEQLSKLPGIGKKTAQRLAFYVLEMDPLEVEKLATSIINAKEKIRYCKQCFNLTDDELCSICKDRGRDESLICVVEGARDIVAMEKTREFKGLYHVLHGVISPMKNIGPDDIRIKELLNRAYDSQVKEIILALNPTVEGEATSLYIAKYLSHWELKPQELPMAYPLEGT